MNANHNILAMKLTTQGKCDFYETNTKSKPNEFSDFCVTAHAISFLLRWWGNMQGKDFFGHVGDETIDSVMDKVKSDAFVTDGPSPYFSAHFMQFLNQLWCCNRVVDGIMFGS